MNETDKSKTGGRWGEKKGNDVLEKVQYVTRPHASTVVVTIHNPTPGQLQNCSVLRSNGFACINVTLHIKVFLVEAQSVHPFLVYVAGICGRPNSSTKTPSLFVLLSLGIPSGIDGAAEASSR